MVLSKHNIGNLMLSKDYLHIETTNRCMLKCPACARTVWHNLIKRPVEKADLNLNHLKSFLDCESMKTIKGLLLCGDYGDTIYYPQLFDMIKMFRDKAFYIHTNGSRKSKEWWEELNSLLTEEDLIVFAIDGLGEENLKYRVNADWDSIMTGIDVVTKGSARIECHTLIFDFNHDKLDEIKQWAESKGMAWKSKKSMRFGDKAVKPKDKSLVDEQELYKSEYANKDTMEIAPRCLEASVVTSDGYFMPCDWIRNPLTFYRSELYLDKEKWTDRLKISDITLDQAYGVLAEWIENVKDKGIKGEAEVLCKMKCRAC